MTEFYFIINNHYYVFIRSILHKDLLQAQWGFMSNPEY